MGIDFSACKGDTDRKILSKSLQKPAKDLEFIFSFLNPSKTRKITKKTARTLSYRDVNQNDLDLLISYCLKNVCLLCTPRVFLIEHWPQDPQDFFAWLS